MDSYQIVLNGIMLAMEPQQVREQFALAFGIDAQKAARILDKPGTVLKRNLDAAAADAYRDRMFAIGVDVDIRRIAEHKPAVLLSHALTATDETSVPGLGAGLSVEPLDARYASKSEPRNDLDLLAPTRESRFLDFTFTGHGSEYFRIWIVNVFLSIITAGIYSAWAKVRTLQYFYGNTFLGESAFQYLATPMQVLRGRIIAVVIFGALFALKQYSATAALCSLLIFIAAAPALLVMALRARMRFTAWRNVRFDFSRDFREAYLAMKWPALLLLLFYVALYLAGMLDPHDKPLEPDMHQLYPVMGSMLVLFALMPYFDYLFNSFVCNRVRFGQAPLVFHATPGSYYKLYGKMLLIPLGLGILIAVGSVSFGKLMPLLLANGANSVLIKVLPVVAVSLMMMAFYVLPFAFLQAHRFNLRYNGMMVGKSTLYCNLSTLPLLWLYVSNTFALVLSAGLLIPWAKIRTARYRIECLSLHAASDLEDIVNTPVEGDALGQEMGDFFDVDIAL